jgi:hypothetical protein
MNGWEVIDEREQLYDAMIAIAVRQLDKAGLAQLLQALARPDEDDSSQAS